MQTKNMPITIRRRVYSVKIDTSKQLKQAVMVERWKYQFKL